MASARIAVVFFLVIVPVAGAQQSPTTALTIQVTDLTGAVVPGAQVDVGPLWCVEVGGETDDQGKIGLKLNLAPATTEATTTTATTAIDTQMIVTFPGFCPERRPIKVVEGTAQEIPVVLEVGGCPSKCMASCVTVEPAEPAEPAARPFNANESGIFLRISDFTGAVVPGARIEVDPSLTKPGPVTKTDRNGAATMQLPSGMHALHVSAPGFHQWNHRIAVPSDGGRAIEVLLQVEPICNWVVAPAQPLISPSEIDGPDALTLEPVSTFAPLPSRRKKKWW